jgi:hypothetical protein
MKLLLVDMLERLPHMRKSLGSIRTTKKQTNKKKNKWIIILNTWEAEIEIVVWGQSRQKVHQTLSHLNGKSWAWWCTPVILAIEEA